MNDGNNRWDDDCDPIASLDGGLDRRRFLGVATGGFVLTATGLLLPEWLEEAEAREGALGAAMGGRHGKDRRGRGQRKRRTHGDRKNKRQAQDLPLPFRNTAITVRNDLAEPVPCIFFAAHNTHGNDYDPFFKVIEHAVNNEDHDHDYRFDPLELRAGVLIRELNEGQDIFCDVRNLRIGYPRGGVSTGVALDPANGNVGTAHIPEQDFAVDDEKFKPRVVLRRLSDDSNGERRIEWRLTVR
jgi:hypothetical protein